VKSLVVVLALSLLAIPAAAQETVRNPHGPVAEECGACHRPEGWRPAQVSARFEHARGRFPLEGAHARTGCTACHTTLAFRGTPSTCAGCHTDVHRGELGTECGRCHTPRTFVDRAAMRRVHQVTRFPLSGAHAAAECEACHAPAAQGALRFVARPPECEGCHRDAIGAATQPDHRAAGFVRECERCHVPVAWNRARFDHATTRFPLDGAHRAATCEGCHGDRVYRGKATACVGCHQADYDATTNPAHRAAGFPTDCASCHRTTGWPGAAFDHDARLFPINSGPHRGKWSGCATCHVNPSNYRQFTCLSCHEHRRSEADDEHDDTGGYRYESSACYACHRNGREP
jgi:hypothetical protein